MYIIIYVICVYTHRNETRNDSLVFFMKPFSVSVSQDHCGENEPNIFGFLKGITVTSRKTQKQKQTSNFLERKKKSSNTVSFNSLLWVLVDFCVFDVGAEKSEKPPIKNSTPKGLYSSLQGNDHISPF